MFFIILEAIHSKTFLINLTVEYENTKCPELVKLFVPLFMYIFLCIIMENVLQ